MKKVLIIAPLILLASACATTQTSEAPSAPPAPAPSASAAADAIASAEAAAAKADAVGYQWRDTAALIDEAKKAMESNDSAKATALAKQAQHEAENALAQYEAQKDAGSRN